jgi:hypothetical protein
MSSFASPIRIRPNYPSRVFLTSIPKSTYSTPEKLTNKKFQKRFERVLNGLNQTRHEIKSASNSFTTYKDYSKYNTQRPRSDMRYQQDHESLKNRYWKSYSGKSVSRELKNKYDYSNPSPITWTYYTDYLVKAIPKKTYSNYSIQNSHPGYWFKLNPKRIPKGMGYKKSNIFF